MGQEIIIKICMIALGYNRPRVILLSERNDIVGK
nr:MAG TPA: hypothetical protein [Caudoviricetes sp.]